MTWKNLQVRRKIIVCFTIPITLIVLFAVWTFSVTNAVYSNIETVKDKKGKIQEKLRNLHTDLDRYQKELMEIRIFHND